MHYWPMTNAQRDAGGGVLVIKSAIHLWWLPLAESQGPASKLKGGTNSNPGTSFKFLRRSLHRLPQRPERRR